MIDLSKYSEKEVFAAIRAVEEIVDMEDFGLFVDEDDGELCFALEDHQGANLGDIESDRFDSLGGVLDRMEIYHNDYFYEDYQERVCNKVKIPQDDGCREVIVFLENDYVAELLSCIDVETYQKYRDKSLDEIGLNSSEVKRYVTNELLYRDGFDAIDYVVDKAIAMEILKTESAYLWFEHEGKFYLSDYGLDDIYETNECFKEHVLKVLNDEVYSSMTGQGGLDTFWKEYDVYSEVINSEFGQIQEDMRDIGLYDDKDNWDFYLSEYELEYIGLGDEKDKMKLEYKDVAENEVKDNNIDSVIDNAVSRSGVEREDANSGKHVDEVEFE